MVVNLSVVTALSVEFANETHQFRSSQSQGSVNFRYFLVAAILLIPAVSYSVTGSAQFPAAPIEKPGVDLPKGRRAWAVHVIRIGGLTGDNDIDVTITSENKVTCSIPEDKCRSQLAMKELDAVAEAILTSQFSKPDKNKKSSNTFMCHDCSMTAIKVSRRDEKGKESSFSGQWQSTSTASVSPDLIRIAGMILQL